MNRSTRDPAHEDTLSLEVLESLVGAAGIERKQELTAEQAAAMTAGAHDSPALVPTNDPGLPPKQLKDTEDKVHTSAATPMKVEPGHMHFGVEREKVYAKYAENSAQYEIDRAAGRKADPEWDASNASAEATVKAFMEEFDAHISEAKKYMVKIV